MNSIYTINAIHVDAATDSVALIDYSIEFSDSAFGDVRTWSAGLIEPVETTPRTASNADLVLAVRQRLGLQLPLIEAHSRETLRLQYLKQETLKEERAATPTPEEMRAKMRPLTPREFRDALVDNDIFADAVTTAIQQIADPKARAKAMNAWEYPTEFRRTDPLVDQIAAAFSLSPEAVDTLWQSVPVPA